MSVEKTPTGWRVRYRDGDCNRSKNFDRKRDAQDYDGEIRRLKRDGGLGLLHGGEQTLDDFAREWFSKYATSQLALKTRQVYAGLWDKHVLPVLGGYRLRDLTPEHVHDLHAACSANGLAVESVGKVHAILQGVLRRAVEWRRIAYNPAALVRKPRGHRRPVRALAPATVEAIRQHFLAEGRLRDAMIVSTLAYAGLRPGELRAVTWERRSERVIHVAEAVSTDRVGPTKTRRERTVPLLAPLAEDLLEWELASGRPAGSAFMFPTAARDGKRAGGVWTDRGWNAWQREQFRPAAEAAGVPDAVPYHLRHSYVSLLLQDGVQPLEVARSAGHAPSEMWSTYGHLIEGFDPTKRVPVEDAIRAARGKSVPLPYLRRAAAE